MKWAISESETNGFGLCYGVYQKAVCTGTGLITPHLTFLYTSFEKIFCQNLVKKNCKFVAGVSSHNTCIWHEKRLGKCTSDGLLWFTCCGNINLLLRKIVGCFRLPRSFIAEISDLCYDNIRLLLRQYQFIVMIKHILRCINADLLLS